MDASCRTLMPAGWEPAVPFDRCFDAQYGLEVLSEAVEAGGLVRARIVVSDELLSQMGVVHGGVFASAAEAMASRGTALVMMPHGRQALGLSNDTTVVASPTKGVITVEARVRARGDDEWVWTVEARDDSGRLCAHSRVTVALRD